MANESIIKLFEGNQVRILWKEDEEKYYFSVVDIVGVLTDSVNPTDYLKKLRKRDPELGVFLGTNCPQVAMLTSTGKYRITLAADLSGIFRIIQSGTRSSHRNARRTISCREVRKRPKANCHL